MKQVKTTAAAPKIAILVSRYNEDIASGLLTGALTCLGEYGIDVPKENIIDAPGAFEIPLIAKTLAMCGRFDGIVCLGCVVKGETSHFEYISAGVSMGLMNASLDTGVPLSFGILTTYSQEQAMARSANNAHNKGREAAAACVQSIASMHQISTRESRQR